MKDEKRPLLMSPFDVWTFGRGIATAYTVMTLFNTLPDEIKSLCLYPRNSGTLLNFVLLICYINYSGPNTSFS